MTTSSTNHDDPRSSLGKSRTLFDIIQDEQSGTAYKNLVERYSNTKNHPSKSLRDCLRIHPSSSAISSSSSLSLSASSSKPVPASDVRLPSNCKSLHRSQSSLQTTDNNSSHQSLLQRTTTHSSFQRTQSTLLQRTQSSLSSRSQHLLIPANPDEPQGEEHQAEEAAVIPPDKQGEDASVGFPIAEEYQEDELVENEDDDEEQQQQLLLHINGGIEDKSKNSNIFNNNESPVRISLLDLLAETDRQAGLVGRTYLTTNDDDDDDDDEDEEGGEEDQGAEEGGGECVCCVCMVRHKGAAFIPCGHTFCRLCSRELWVSRGNCPLCNAYILEILDIF